MKDNNINRTKIYITGLFGPTIGGPDKSVSVYKLKSIRK